MSARPIADGHDLIRVHGARREQPEGRQHRDPEAPADGVHRRLGLGQELAGVQHDRRGVAAADQRDVQRVRAGLHADAGPAGSRRARRADDGDRRRPATDGGRRPFDGRHRHRCQRDAAHPLQPARKAVRRAADAFAFNVPSVRASGEITVERGGSKTVQRSFTRTGGMCPSCEGRGTVSDFDLTQLYDETKSLAEGAIVVPGYTVDNFFAVRPFLESGILDPDKPIAQVHQEGASRLPPPRADQGEGQRRQRHLRGTDRQDPAVDPRQGQGALQPHIRAFVDRRSPSPPAPTATAPGSAKRRDRRRSRG